MQRLRVLFRACLMILVTAMAHLTLIVMLPMRRLAPITQLRWRNRIFRAWARAVARVMGMRISVDGTPPTGPFFLVSNHLGYTDIILLASQVDAAFVAKADLRGWPLLGRAFQTADTIFIDRGRRRDVIRVMERIEHDLARDLGVVLFPEGTSGNGEGVLPFKPSLLELPARRAYPVRVAAIAYQTPEGAPEARDVVCWWGDAPFMPHILGLLALPYFEARISFVPEVIQEGDRKDLAHRLRATMQERFVTLR